VRAQQLHLTAGRLRAEVTLDGAHAQLDRHQGLSGLLVQFVRDLGLFALLAVDHQGEAVVLFGELALGVTQLGLERCACALESPYALALGCCGDLQREELQSQAFVGGKRCMAGVRRDLEQPDPGHAGAERQRQRVALEHPMLGGPGAVDRRAGAACRYELDGPARDEPRELEPVGSSGQRKSGLEQLLLAPARATHAVGETAGYRGNGDQGAGPDGHLGGAQRRVPGRSGHREQACGRRRACDSAPHSELEGSEHDRHRVQEAGAVGAARTEHRHGEDRDQQQRGGAEHNLTALQGTSDGQRAHGFLHRTGIVGSRRPLAIRRLTDAPEY
jgi:hypothetical protein